MRISFTPPAQIDSQFYESLTWRQQRSLRGLVGGIVEEVGARLEHLIELPARTEVGFADLDGLAGIRDGRMLFDTNKTLRLARSQQAVIAGLAVHEFSHLSDEEVQPDIFGTSIGVVVAEGKADQLAHEQIGDDDWGLYLGAAPSAETLAYFYHQSANGQQDAVEGESGSAGYAAPIMSTTQVMPGIDIYGLGYDLVNRVMSATSETSIIPIHAQSVDYYWELSRRSYVDLEYGTGV